MKEMNKKDLGNAGNLAKKEGFTHKVGDGVERLGEKISHAGASKLGNAIYKAGNKIEHSRDNKPNRK